MEEMQIAQLLQVSIKTARKILQTTRLALGKDSKDEVSVKEFCYVNKLDEEDVRNALLNLS